jgi:hypothetical protein
MLRRTHLLVLAILAIGAVVQFHRLNAKVHDDLDAIGRDLKAMTKDMREHAKHEHPELERPR